MGELPEDAACFVFALSVSWSSICVHIFCVMPNIAAKLKSVSSCDASS